jgi:hypothetical protein
MIPIAIFGAAASHAPLQGHAVVPCGEGQDPAASAHELAWVVLGMVLLLAWFTGPCWIPICLGEPVVRISSDPPRRFKTWHWILYYALPFTAWLTYMWTR